MIGKRKMSHTGGGDQKSAKKVTRIIWMATHMKFYHKDYPCKGQGTDNYQDNYLWSNYCFNNSLPHAFCYFYAICAHGSQD